MSDSEPFYTPTPDMFGHADAYRLFTGYAAELEQTRFASRLRAEPTDVRHVAIELLAERHAIVDLEAEPEVIEESIEEAREILEERRQAER